jgi:transaldolase/glucose-6-phosphate isomerase
MIMNITLRLGKLQTAVDRRLARWAEEKTLAKLWAKDGTVWVPDPEQMAKTNDLTNRLDWLELPVLMSKRIAELQAFADEVRAAGFNRIVLLGMGGSSLAPEVFMKTFGAKAGFPTLAVLDSTSPEMVAQIAQTGDLKTTLFVVSSKSGGTIETMSFFKYFYAQLSELTSTPGDHFIAITDPGSGLEALAKEKNFRKIFDGPPNVGGRFSALTNFGLLPAALIGVDLKAFLASASDMATACGPSVSPDKNPGAFIGAVMGECARVGRNKWTFVIAPEMASFGAWAEQLIAESTGKNGKGIVPVLDEPLGAPDVYGSDRVFIQVMLKSKSDANATRKLNALESAGHPVIIIELDTLTALGGEFFCWELATALAGAVLGINPFDQPDVESAKKKARAVMAAGPSTGSTSSLQASSGIAGARDEKEAAAFLGQALPGDYIAMMAYLPMTADVDQKLKRLQAEWRNRYKVAVTIGYGPRFLHSTGQLHKGDGNQALAIVLTQIPSLDLPVPGEAYTFGVLIAAQAQGDTEALREKGRRVLSLDYGILDSMA